MHKPNERFNFITAVLAVLFNTDLPDNTSNMVNDYFTLPVLLTSVDRSKLQNYAVKSITNNIDDTTIILVPNN